MVSEIPSTSASVGSPPASLNSLRRSKNKKPKKKSSLRVLAEILCALLLFEIYFYRKMTLQQLEIARMELEGGDDDDIGGYLLTKMTKMKDAFKGGSPQKRRSKHEIEQAKKREQRKIERESEKLEYEALLEKYDGETDTDIMERVKAAKKLAHMKTFVGYDLEELPPWSQIEENFGIPFYENPSDAGEDDEPVILGLEYCEDFRRSSNPRIRGVGPAGLFSTGTNLINALIRNNCRGPVNQTGHAGKFALIQVPYGKHNPADARFHHQVKNPVVKDREAILPVVMIRHPYTWMAAMCKYSYNTRWRHVPHKCWETVFLKNPVVRVPWGFKQYNDTHNVTNSYDSLATMWLEWNKPYFLEHQYNQAPRLMVRHEDMVYRPNKVVRKICECVGGTHMKGEDADWETEFEFEEESANKGKGHGKHGRSGLLEAFIKYGTPLDEWYSRFSMEDKEVMQSTFLGDGIDPKLKTIFETFRYKLFDPQPTTKEEHDRNKKKYMAKLSANDTKNFQRQQKWTDGPPEPHRPGMKRNPNVVYKADNDAYHARKRKQGNP